MCTGTPWASPSPGFPAVLEYPLLLRGTRLHLGALGSSGRPPVVILQIGTARGLGRRGRVKMGQWDSPRCLGVCDSLAADLHSLKGTPGAVKAKAECLLWATFQTKSFCNYIA